MGELVGKLQVHSAERTEPVLQRVAFAHTRWAARLIAPERGVPGLFIQFGKTALRGIDVKDASSAAPSTA